jgi:hypothetical protein
MFCKSILKGRSDKKFCNIDCKNSYNNPINRERERTFKVTEKRLRKNHSALKMFYEFSQDEKFLPIKQLYQQGFDPQFYTGTFTLNDSGETVYMVYDFAFLIDQKLGIKIYNDEKFFRDF